MQPINLQFNIGEEARIVCAEDGADMVLLEGVAQYLGAPLPIGHPFALPPHSVRSVYSPGGALIRLDSHGDIPPGVVKGQHGMAAYYGEYVQQLMAQPPFRVVMVCPPGCGLAATLAQVVCNVACLQGMSVQLVDMDYTGTTLFTMPGTVSSIFVEDLLPIEEGFSPYIPLTFMSGVESGPRMAHACSSISRASAAVGMSERPSGRPLGGVVVLCTSTSPEEITNVCASFEATVVFVFGPTALCDTLRPLVPVHVVEMPFVTRLNYDATPGDSMRFREYFFGTRTPLHPVTLMVSLDDVVIIEMNAENNGRRVDAVARAQDLAHRVVALSHAQREVEVPVANVAGFCVVVAISEEERMVTLVSPAPAPLPSPFLVLTESYVSPQALIP
eukprot:PhM_4_TR19061/c0_g1_i1/m.103206/K14399/CLP1, HERB; polyribonucleotide 5'-hydroxyl-kinase